MSTATKTKKPSRILADAAKWIEEHGLAKGDFFKYRNHRTFLYDSTEKGVEIALKRGCRTCAMGAIYVANGGVNNLPRGTFDYVQGVIDTTWIAEWNDDPKRTQAEVVDALKKAARAARKDGK